MRLTRPQLNALTMLVMAGARGATAYKLGVGRATLRALAKRGLAEYRPRLGDGFSPRMIRYAVTDKGYEVHREEMDNARRR
jgi:DNA-binding PadR family transcriptional regulator